MTQPVGDLAEMERRRHAAAVHTSSYRSRAADVVADECRETFYESLVAAHGSPAEGKLTYDEIADVSGWSRGWVRMAITKHKKRKANTT